MNEAEADPASNLPLMKFRDRVGPAELAPGRSPVTVARERLWA